MGRLTLETMRARYYRLREALRQAGRLLNEQDGGRLIIRDAIDDGDNIGRP